MKVLYLDSRNERAVLRQAADFLKRGKVIVYPTDTTYGLGGLAFDASAINKIYKMKRRKFIQPIHILVPSIRYAKRIVKWNKLADKLAKKFLPGPLSLALPLRSQNKQLKKLTAGTGYLGIRLPKDEFAQALAQALNQPITATSANPSKYAGGHNPYSVQDVIAQFQGRKYKPDLIISAGKLAKRKPSTFVKIANSKIEILRPGPISKRQIFTISQASAKLSAGLIKK